MSSIEVPTEEIGDATVTPVVLREELRSPSDGTLYSERVSCSFYTKYRKYKNRVEHANRGGAIRHQVMPISQLVPVHLQLVYAGVFYDKHTTTTQQLAVEIK